MNTETILIIYYHHLEDATHYVMKRQKIVQSDEGRKHVNDDRFHFESPDLEDLRLFARTSGYSSNGLSSEGGIEWELWDVPGELQF